MNRKLAEKLIAGLLRQIIEIYLAFDPEADYLSLCYIKSDDGDASISFDNCPHKAANPISHREIF